MKIQEHDYGFDAVLPENRTPFKIKTSAKLFDILSSGIYKDKILAVIRELSCNAYDAHVSVGKKNTPFKIQLPTRLEPTFYIEDEGSGIDPDRIEDIYWTYGESSKTDSNDQIGALGLGSKSPFAYTKSSFVVKNRYQGVEYTYLCFINENGMPDGSMVGKEPTEKLSGITVEFAVRPEDVHAFEERTKRFFKYWEAVKPIFVDRENVLNTKIEKVIQGTDWYLENCDSYVAAPAIALQGNVPYPIETDSIPNLPKDLEIIASNQFIITFQMGEVNFASSREALQYDERTCANVIARLQEVRAELELSFREKVTKKGMTHLDFIQNFRKTFLEFKNTVKTSNAKHGHLMSVYDWYSRLLLNSKPTDTIEYNGYKYVINDLLNGEITFESAGHQSFGLYSYVRKSSNRTKVNQLTKVKYYPVNDIPGILLRPQSTSANMISAGSEFIYDWKNQSVPKRAMMTEYFRIIENRHLFTVDTVNTIPVIPPSGSPNLGMFFYVNDLGSAGEARFKLLPTNQPSFFVNFDAKVTSVHTVIDELTEFVKNGLSGANIILLSTMPDLRPQIEREKIETGSVRLKYFDLLFQANPAKHTVRDTICVNAKIVDHRVESQSIVKLADLKAEPYVLYVLKRRSQSQFYDLDNHPSIINDRTLVGLAAHYKLVDTKPFVAEGNSLKRYEGRDSLRVLVLTEGQATWLHNKKVKLVSLKSHIDNGITALEAAEKFHDKVERSLAVHQVRLIVNLCNSVDQYKKDTNFTDRLIPIGPSLIKTLYQEYLDIKLNQQTLADAYAKLKIYETVKGTHTHGDEIAEKILTSIHKQYPMLEMINVSYCSKKQLNTLFDYIDERDL